MQRNLRNKAKNFARQGTVRKTWQRVVSGMTCAVVFCTTYALILPAITMEGDAFCAIQEHTHNEACYSQENTAELVCDPVHSHGDGCYGADGSILCGEADFVLHSHDALCYDASGALQCTLPQVTEYADDTGVYYIIEGTQSPNTSAHFHTDGCYTTQRGALLCSLADGEAHIHGTDCWGEPQTVCGLEETEAHWHSESCYGAPEVTCGQEEIAGHAHGSSCNSEPVLTCSLPETAGHGHSETCYGEQSILCGLEEDETHTHEAGCLSEAPLICGMEEAAEHWHSESCYVTELVCGQEEQEGHTHSESCEEIPLVCILSEEAHFHDDSCYEQLSVLGCGKLELQEHIHNDGCLRQKAPEELMICTVAEHTHLLSCYANPNADVETESYWKATMANADLTGSAAEDLLAIARTQVGYTESKANYAVMDDGITIKGYSRYGAWAGNAYADWNQLFAEFCLHYAGIKTEDFPRASGGKTWVQVLNEKGLFRSGITPVSGNLMFLTIEGTDYVGIVTAVSDGYVTAILGDYKNEVRSETFTLNDAGIAGYAALPEPEQTETTAPTETTAEPTETTTPPTTAATEVTEGTTSPVEEEKEPLVANVILDVAFAPSEYTTFAVLRNIAMMASSDGTSTVTLGIDLQEFIDGISIFHTSIYYEEWKELQAGETVNADELVRFDINYTIDGNTLSDSNKFVTYQLPITKIDQAVEGQPVYNNGGLQVGTYAISVEGLITITFYDSYVRENANGVPITGNVSFKSLATQLDTDGDGIIDLQFSDKEKVEITIHEVINNDLTIEKTATELDENGYATFTVNINSQNGTKEAVSFSDTMTNMTYVDGFTVTDSNGENVTAKFTAPEAGSTNFSLNIPKMEKDSSYTVTYRCKISDFSGDVIKGNNAASVTSKDNNGNTLQDSTSIAVERNNDMLSKTGVVSGDGKTVTWTITVGGVGQDLSGWTLTDTVNGVPLQGNVAISYHIQTQNTATDSAGETTTETVTTSQEVMHTLPYVFPENSVGPAVVTYTTTIDYALNGYGMTNTATLTPPEGTSYPNYSDSDTAQRPNDWSSYNPLSKQAMSIQPNTEKTEAVIHWTLTIDSEKGAIYADITYNSDGTIAQNNGWYFMDLLDNNQTISDVQWQTLEQNVTDALTSVYGWNTEDVSSLFKLEPVTENGKNGFKVTVYETLPAEKEFTIEYESTAALGDGNSEKTFFNSANINNRVTASDSAKYYPVVVKSDASNNSVNDSTHAMMDLENRTVSWKIQLYIPKEYGDSSIKVVEDLPNQLNLTGISMTWAGQTQDFVLEEDGTVSITTEQGSISSTLDTETNTLTLTLPQPFVSAYKQQLITFVVTTKLPDDYTIEGDTTATDGKVELGNVVTIKSVTNDTETDIGSDGHKQTITSEDTVVKVDKSYGEVKNNRIPYSVDINPNASDLLAGSDTLTLRDVMTFNNKPSQGYVFSVTLVSDSVKVYEIGTDGSKTDITSQITYTYKEESNIPYDGQVDYTYTLELNIPDGKHLCVEYVYLVNGTVSETSYAMLQNAASLVGVSGKSEDSNQIQHKIQLSDATANLEGISILKVDSVNQAQMLPGATYELYQYNSENDQWQFVKGAYSDANGRLDLDNLVVNQAYYLIETKAPSGYVLDQTRHYFLIHDHAKITEQTPLIAPENFPSTAYLAKGSVLRFPNKRLGNSLEVEKLWANVNGGLIEAPSDASIGVNLMQVWNRYPSDFNTALLGNDAEVSVAFGGYSHQTDVASGAQTVNATVGDIITITLRTTHIPEVEGTTALPAGLMEVTSSANNHISSTVVQDGDYYIYTFQYLVTGDATLRGWVYPKNVENSTFTAAVTTEYSDVNLTRDPIIYQSLTLSEATGWSSSFTDLPQYELSSIGQITGYYTYYAQETSDYDGYRVTYTGAYSKETAVDSGTVTITNIQKKPELAELDVKKAWFNSSTQSTSAPEGVDHVQFMLYQVYTDNQGNVTDPGKTESTTQQKATLSGEITFDRGTSWTYPKVTNLDPGSKVTLKVSQLWGASDAMHNIQFNGTAQTKPSTYTTEESVHQNHTACVFTYEFTLQPGDNTIGGSLAGYHNLDTANYSDWLIQIYVPDSDDVSGDSGIYGPYNIWAGNNWIWESSDVAAFADGLPLKKYAADGTIEGTYTYYVKEITTGYDHTISSGNAQNAVNSGTITITNTYTTPVEETTEITVNKEWLTKDGTEIKNMTNISSIQFYLKRRVEGSEAAEIVDNPKDDAANSPYTLVKGEETGWSMTIPGLPKTDASKNPYIYFVEEVRVDGYDTSYSTDGNTITITNQVEESVYELPETGGAGTFLYTLSGLVLCSTAALGYNHKKRRKEDQTS